MSIQFYIQILSLRNWLSIAISQFSSKIRFISVKSELLSCDVPRRHFCLSFNSSGKHFQIEMYWTPAFETNSYKGSKVFGCITIDASIFFKMSFSNYLRATDIWFRKGTVFHTVFLLGGNLTLLKYSLRKGKKEVHPFFIIKRSKVEIVCQVEKLWIHKANYSKIRRSCFGFMGPVIKRTKNVWKTLAQGKTPWTWSELASRWRLGCFSPRIMNLKLKKKSWAGSFLFFSQSTFV